MLMRMLACVPSLASTSMKAGHCTDALTIVPAAASAMQADYASVCNLCVRAKPSSQGSASTSVRNIWSDTKND